MTETTATRAFVPGRLTRTAERRSNRLRVSMEDFLNCVPFCAEAAESEIKCRAVPKGPPLHFQLIPVDKAPPFDLAGGFRDAFRSPLPEVFDSNSSSLEVARWIAEEEATNQMVLAITKTPSGYRMDLPLWVRQALRLPDDDPRVTFFAVGNVLELYSVAAWYERLAAIQRRLEDEEERGELLTQLARRP